jgi:hypothetical protein
MRHGVHKERIWMGNICRVLQIGANICSNFYSRKDAKQYTQITFLEVQSGCKRPVAEIPNFTTSKSQNVSAPCIDIFENDLNGIRGWYADTSEENPAVSLHYYTFKVQWLLYVPPATTLNIYILYIDSVRRRVYVWMCPSLVPERLDGFYSYSSIQEFIHHSSVPSEYQHPKFKNRGPSDKPPSPK